MNDFFVRLITRKDFI